MRLSVFGRCHTQKMFLTPLLCRLQKGELLKIGLSAGKCILECHLKMSAGRAYPGLLKSQMLFLLLQRPQTRSFLRVK